MCKPNADTEFAKVIKNYRKGNRSLVFVYQWLISSSSHSRHYTVGDFMSGILEEVKKERERFVAFAFAAAEIFLEVDSEGKILFEGGASAKIGPAGQTSSLVGTLIRDIISEDDRTVYDAVISHVSHKGRIGPIPLRFISENGRDYALRLFALHMPGKDARTFLALRSAPLGGPAIDPSLQSETGLLTQEGFLEIASKTMADPQAGGHMYVTAVEIEGLDQVKQKFGPKVVKSLMDRMAAHIKSIAVDGEVAGQIGDNQFAFMHRSQADGAYIGKALESVDPKAKISTDVATIAAEPGQLEEAQLLKTLSYVLSSFCTNSKSVTFDTFASAYDDMAQKAQKRVSTIRSTIESGSFKMVFQPVVSLSTGDVHHNEILSRFDSDGSSSTPLEMIRFAEDVGMIEEFDIALCEKAVDYVRKMRRLGDPVRLAVNVSGKTINSDPHLARLGAVMEQAKDISHSLLIELTETSEVSKMEQAEAFFNDLKSKGFKICLDDFGSGAAGYQYLRAFSVDYVKIDGAYVRSMAEPNYKPTFLLSMVRLCHDLGVKTIGEHVETKFQADFLKSLGVDFAQGFHYGRPDYTPRIDP